MQINVGNLDRIVRIVIGLILLSLPLWLGLILALAGTHWNHATPHRPGRPLSLAIACLASALARCENPSERPYETQFFGRSPRSHRIVLSGRSG
jgi:hypothetical protein